MTRQSSMRLACWLAVFGSSCLPAVVYRVNTIASAAVDTGQQPKEWTAAEDHRQMMEQLGIRSLRPGPSGNEQAPNHANYDEALANPFPKLPEVLTLSDGSKVTNADNWWKQRRPEIVEDFEREVLGRVPNAVPKVTWTVVATTETTIGTHPVLGRQLAGRVDNSAYPAIAVDIQLIVVTPVARSGSAKKPVPVMMMIGGRALPGLPGFTAPGGGRAGAPPAAPQAADPPATEQLIADGWGYASISPSSIQADNGAGLTKGIIGLVNRGEPRKPDD